eukprot:gene8910-9862_t
MVNHQLSIRSAHDNLEGTDVEPGLFEDVSFLCLRRENFLRKQLINLVQWRWFERFVIVIILFNCAMLAMFDPLDRKCLSRRCQVLEKLEMVVFSFFATEMLVKMTAMGVYGSKSYFSDGWNIFDFFIVIIGIVDMVGPGGDFLTIVRLGRVLRPLRAINRVPSIRILVTLLMDTIPMLGNVLLLAFLVFSMFGIVGVQVWQGKLRNRCFLDSNYSAQSLNMSKFYEPEGGDFLCSLTGGMQKCSDIIAVCSEGGIHGNTTCAGLSNYYSKCEQNGPNPYYDNMSFDNIAMAWIFIFQVVTVEGWSELMYLIQDSSSFYSWIYFVVLITIGSFFLVNLSLVVITMQFSETKRREMQIIREYRKRHISGSQMSLVSDFRMMWQCIVDRFSCKRKGSVHHFHHHEYFHIHHHTVRCEKCNMQFHHDSQEQVHSPKAVSSEKRNSIPRVEISCFDDDVQSNEVQLCRRLSLSCPSLFSIEQGEAESRTPLKSPHLNVVGQQVSLDLDHRTSNSCSRTRQFLTPLNNNYSDTDSIGRRTSDVSNSLSIHAESISSISIEKTQSPAQASLTTKTSLSLLVNGTSTQLKTEAYCKANASIVKDANAGVDVDVGVGAGVGVVNGGGGGGKVELSTAEAKASSSVLKLQTPKKRLSKSPSVASKFSGISDNKNDDVSDFADTSSEALYGSMFDLRNADKYYVSVEPTFLQKFRRNCKKLSESRKFSHFIMIIIVLNTICMGLEHHNQPAKMTQVLEMLNLIFIWIFGFEMCIKLLGVGPKSYFRNGFNIFDCLIVVLSVAELLANDRTRSSNVIVLRSLRLLRIFKLVRPMRHQMLVMIRTMSSVMTFFALLFLFMFTFAILGMHLFGGRFVFNGETSRSNFDSFILAMVTVFQILTQEDWNLVMYDGMRATKHKWAALYFLSLMTIGYYVLLNLLVAILVEGFTTPMEKRRMAKRIATMLLNKGNSRSLGTAMSSAALRQRSLSMPEMKDPENADTNCSDRIRTNTDLSFAGISIQSQNKSVPRVASLKSITSLVVNRKEYKSDVLKSEKPKPGEPILVSARHKTSQAGPMSCPYYLLDVNAKQITNADGMAVETENKRLYFYFGKRADWSLFILPPTNKIRKFLQAVSASKWFDYFILTMILFSCVLLAMENPNIDPNSQKREVIRTSMFVLTWLFTAEMMIKVLAHGLVFGRDAYLRRGWNCLDGFLVVISWVDFIMYLLAGDNQTDILKAFRVLRALRSLRPLRMIRRAPGLKLVVQTLLYSLKPIGNTVLIAAIFFVVFGILGVQLMKGTFYHCLGAPYVANKTECEDSPGKWVNYQYNFDDLPMALIALFVVSTKDGWVDIMRRGTDAVDVDKQPQINYAMWRILYFISFLLIGGFLVLNMIVGVVVENFQRCRELQGDKDNAKKALAKWRECARKTHHENFLRKHTGPRLVLYKMCTHSYWDIGITILILLNVICMAIEHYHMPKPLLDFIDTSNIIFTVIYAFEALLQIIAFGFRQYFKNKWYFFDFIVVVISVLGIALEKIIVRDFKINPGVVRGLRMLRVVRVLKLLKVAKGLQFLLDHIKETIPQVTNLALLFSLLFFIYSCLGIQLFGTIGKSFYKFNIFKCSAATPCTGLGKHANFKDLGSSMLTLFRIATGDNWSGILKDILRPDCDDSSQCTKNCCLSKYAAAPFFVTFVLFAQFVLVNIVIAVLMKHLRVTKLCKDNLSSSNKTSLRRSAAKRDAKNDPGRTAVSKWQQMAAGRKAQRTEAEDAANGTARVKRSSGDYDDDDGGIHMKKIDRHCSGEITSMINRRKREDTDDDSKRDCLQIEYDRDNKQLVPNCNEIYVTNVSNQTVSVERANEDSNKGLSRRKKAVYWQQNSSFQKEVDNDTLSFTSSNGDGGKMDNERNNFNETLIRNTLVHNASRTSFSNADHDMLKEEECPKTVQSEEERLDTKEVDKCDDISDTQSFNSSSFGPCLVDLFCENCNEEEMELQQNCSMHLFDQMTTRSCSSLDENQDALRSPGGSVHENPIFTFGKQDEDYDSPSTLIEGELSENPCRDHPHGQKDGKMHVSLDKCTSLDRLNVLKDRNLKEHLIVKNKPLVSCGSFELISSSSEHLINIKSKEPERIKQDQDEGFTIVLPDTIQMQITQV